MRATHTGAAATKHAVAESWPRSSQTQVSTCLIRGEPTYIQTGHRHQHGHRLDPHLTAEQLLLDNVRRHVGALTTSPIVVSLPPGSTYMVTDRVKFRRLCGDVDEGDNFLESIAACARAAMVECSEKPNTPAPDLCLLNLPGPRDDRLNDEVYAHSWRRIGQFSGVWMPAADEGPAAEATTVGKAYAPPFTT
ncbi:hypothetical protein MTO96_034285 [Rhipicephalus appendiculatus]